MSPPVLEAARSRLAGALQSHAAQVAPPAAEDPTLNPQLLIFDEIASGADFTQSYLIGLLEAARRADRVRVHGYLVDIKRDVDAMIAAYGRISSLEKLGAQS